MIILFGILIELTCHTSTFAFHLTAHGPFVVGHPFLVVWDRETSETIWNQFQMQLEYGQGVEDKVIEINAGQQLTGTVTLTPTTTGDSFIQASPDPDVDELAIGSNEFTISLSNQGTPATPPTATPQNPIQTSRTTTKSTSSAGTTTSGSLTGAPLDASNMQSVTPGATNPPSSLTGSDVLGGNSPSNGQAAPNPSSNSSDPDPPTPIANHTPIIAGAAVGAVALIAILILLFFALRRRSRRAREEQNAASASPLPVPPIEKSVPSQSVKQRELAMMNSTLAPTTESTLSPSSSSNPAEFSSKRHTLTNQSTQTPTSVVPTTTTHHRTQVSTATSPDVITPMSRSPISSIAPRDQQTRHRSSGLTSRQQRLRERFEATNVQVSALESILADANRRAGEDGGNQLKDAYAELARLREASNRLVDLQDSDWARGLVDELPPSYDTIVENERQRS